MGKHTIENFVLSAQCQIFYPKKVTAITCLILQLRMKKVFWLQAMKNAPFWVYMIIHMDRKFRKLRLYILKFYNWKIKKKSSVKLTQLYRVSIIKVLLSKGCKKEPLVRMTSNLNWIYWKKGKRIWHNKKKIPKCMNRWRCNRHNESGFAYKWHFESKCDGFGMSCIVNQLYCSMCMCVCVVWRKKWLPSQ